MGTPYRSRDAVDLRIERGEAPAHGEQRPHILTVVLEDYYHNFKRVIQRSHWSRFEKRVEQSTLRTLDLLDEFDIRGTFFGLGWIASTMPEVISEVARRGHEIASKGYHQRSLREMSPFEFRDDLARSREALERASGQRVIGYRAPGWLRAGDRWALEVLAQEGYAYDSSVKPMMYSTVLGREDALAHRMHFGGHELWEFPISTIRLAGARIPIGAGNYFRQLPEGLIGRAVAHWSRRHEGAPFTMYFHTWELDPEQPQITAAPLLNRIRKYRNLEKVPDILRRYFRQYPFASIRDYLGIRSSVAGLSPASDPRSNGVPPALVESRTPPRAVPRSALPIAIEARAPEKPTRVTLVVPCYNEEHSLPYLANTLRSVEEALAPRYVLEYIFVDDRSADRSWTVLQQLFGEHPRCTLLRHDRNHGVAAGIVTGIRHAETDLVCSIDCDCTYDPHELVAMLPLMTEDVDLVTASPYHPLGHVNNVAPLRLMLSRTLSRIYRLVLRQRLHTFTSCFRIYKRSAVADIELEREGFLGVAELLGRLAISGAVIVEHPATLDVRVLGHSKMRILRTIVGHLELIVSLTRQRWFGAGSGTPRPRPTVIRAGDDAAHSTPRQSV